MNKELTIEEVFNFLEENYPMCKWEIVPTPWSKGKMISWIPEKRFIVEIWLNHYRKEDNQNQFISIQFDDKKRQSGGISPCDDVNELSKYVKRIITNYKPNLFEEVQLCLF